MNRQGLVLTYILGQVPIFLQEWQKSVQIDIAIYEIKSYINSIKNLKVMIMISISILTVELTPTKGLNLAYMTL